MVKVKCVVCMTADGLATCIAKLCGTCCSHRPATLADCTSTTHKKLRDRLKEAKDKADSPAAQPTGFSREDLFAFADRMTSGMGGQVAAAIKEKTTAAAAPSPERSDEPPKLTAEDLGLSGQPKLFAAHPAQMTDEKLWAPFLGCFLVKSRAELDTIDLIRQTMGQKGQEKETILDSTTPITKLIMGEAADESAFAADPPMVRELAGLFALVRGLPTSVKIDRSFYQKGGTGKMEAEDAVNEPIVSRLERQGRALFLEIIEREIQVHGKESLQYVTGDKGARQQQPWVVRAVLVWLASYARYKSTRGARWVVPALMDLLCTQTSLPVTNHVIPLDLLGFFVQLGLIGLVRDLRQHDVLGDSLAAVEASIINTLAKFKTKFITSSDNVSNAKDLPANLGSAPKRQREGAEGGSPRPNKRQRAAATKAEKAAAAKAAADAKSNLQQDDVTFSGPGAAAGGALAGAGRGAQRVHPGPKVEQADVKVPEAMKPFFKPPGADGLYRKCLNPKCQTTPPPFVAAHGVKTPFCKKCAPGMYGR